MTIEQLPNLPHQIYVQHLLCEVPGPFLTHGGAKRSPPFLGSGIYTRASEGAGNQ